MNLEKKTVKQIDEYAVENGIKLPPGLRKQEKISYIESYLNSPKELTGYRDEVVELVPVWQETEDWKAHLETTGWCVVPIPGWKENFKEMFFDWLEGCSEEFSRDDPQTWKTANMVPLLHGIIKHHFGHTELQWQVRELCADIFAEIWNIDKEDLLCSFDGGCFLNTKIKKRRESEATGRERSRGGDDTLDFNVKDLWVHVDTPRDGEECYQGVVLSSTFGLAVSLRSTSSTVVRRTVASSWLKIPITYSMTTWTPTFLRVTFGCGPTRSTPCSVTQPT
jgi:hypothetical protein